MSKPIGTRYRNQNWGVFEDDPNSPFLDMGSGPGWEEAVRIEQERFDRQQAARIVRVDPVDDMPYPTPD